MDAYAYQVVNFLVAQSWQIALLAVAVGLISWALRGRSAHIRYLLWLIVLARCLVPPVLTVPVAVLPEGSAGSSMVGLGASGDYPLPSPPATVRAQPSPHGSRAAALGPREWIALVWAVGALSFSLWIGTRAIRYTAWLRARRRPLPARLWVSVEDLCAGFRFRKRPKIWLLDDITQPFVWGVLRGGVYLPSEFATANRAGQQRGILAHEISHVAHFDAGVNLLQVLAQAVYWFHPLVWWANRRIRQEREKRCDETAVAYLNTPPEHYTGAIVDALAAERRSAHPVPSLAIVGSVRDIEERIKTMLIPGRTFRSRPSLMAATSVLLIAAVTIPTALVLTARGESQSTAQTTDKPAEPSAKPAADSEGPRQDLLEARDFNSRMAFNVWYRDTPRWSWLGIGRTPSDAPLKIPACWVWWVQPQDATIDWDLLVREMRENRVPGLTLNGTTDSDAAHLAELTELCHLDLIRTQITDAGLVHLKGLIRLKSLALPTTQITDAGLEHLKGLTKLRQLQLRRAAITDAGLEHLLKGLSGLQLLDLESTQITDAGLEHLKSLSGLDLLHLSGTQITDAGLEHLEGLTGLTDLWLNDTRITDNGLAHLKGLTGLTILGLSGTRVTDTGLVNLKGMAALGSLGLDGTPVTDAGLLHLKGLAKLWDLSLANTKVTDAGLEHLKGLARLSSLDLSGTQVTDAGIRRLKQSLPGLEIDVKVANTWTPLHSAAQAGDRKMVELLIAKGADVNAGDRYNRTAAEYAMESNHNEVVELLISKGADISPLHLALHLRDLAKAKDLIKNGADVNKRTPYGTTPLHMAAGAGLNDIAGLLIAKGANVNSKDNWDWTPLHDAAENGHKDVVELLLAKGANANAIDPDGRTPLWYAREKVHSSIVDLLQKHGATR